MAKRPEDDIDPFDDFGTEIDDSDIDSLRMSDTDDPFDNDIPDVDVDIEDDDTPKRPKQAGAYSPRPTPGQIVMGVIQVILFAAIFLLIFLAVGFGAVFGGQKIGLVPTRAPGGSGPLIALIPTAGAAQPQNDGSSATAVPVGAPTTAPTVAPTTDASCASANDWWNSQQVKDNYQYFAAAAINDARNSDRISALLEQLRIKRNFVDNFQLNGKPLDACLNDAKADLLKGFDAIIEAARAIGAKDDAALTTQQANATQAFNDMAVMLRKYGVTVDLGTTGA